MKKYLFLLGVLSLMPLIAQADVSLDINIPGVSLHLGDQDNRGYYWDGYDWRPPQWWHEHRGGHIGDRNERGYYWDGGRWQRPSEQDGHNPFKGQNHGEPQHNNRDDQNHSPQHNDNNGHGKPGNNNGQGNSGKQGGPNNHGGQSNNSGRGGQQVYPPQKNGYR
ncbi:MULTISPECIES: DUF2502 domain-containing protein [Yersinia]|uniref:DUF2502 domain-containing protein n=1 Tax=Yersinia TaxID=629 RepID=UPI0005DCC68A|nr:MULTISPECIES: DUF2502 domain-containing protein [Yersinia]OVZ93136.1 hypothetical protein CBW53_22160 [Yersinia frederiksenii]RXA93752.1 DUF2502 domain-containing protein [Yersinia sp. 2105 StPb PI]CNI00383.1 Protein of uncharacterised function (DUF2502) [Yersinia frederiksenii]CNI01950.1 Protein of uncharacterised function (DUF2502) [Yersinia frederiksenii]CNL09754.1 Protein of uncharacterised function (DUF2502) [Yersinia frederiksenii]